MSKKIDPHTQKFALSAPKIYDRIPTMTEQEFDNIADKDLWFDIHRHIYTQYPNNRFVYYEEVLKLNRSCQAVCLINLLDRQVFNGGFCQYYFNTECRFVANDCVGLLPTLYKLVGADTLADICQRAESALLDDIGPVTRIPPSSEDGDDYLPFVVTWKRDLFDTLDKEYWANMEALEKIMIQFIRKNKQDFID